MILSCKQRKERHNRMSENRNQMLRQESMTDKYLVSERKEEEERRRKRGGQRGRMKGERAGELRERALPAGTDGPLIVVRAAPESRKNTAPL